MSAADRKPTIGQIAALYNAGHSLAEVAAELGTSAETVRRIMARHHIPRRPRGQAARAGCGRSTDKDGYVLVRDPHHPDAVNGYVREHRLVMERALGRRLGPEEVVHHLNGARDDNRRENLRLFESISALASFVLQGNSHARGDFGNPKRRRRVKRTPRQLLRGVAELAAVLDRPIRRSDLKPPYPSYRALNRAFGSWWSAVALSGRKDIQDDPTLIMLFAQSVRRDRKANEEHSQGLRHSEATGSRE